MRNGDITRYNFSDNGGGVSPASKLSGPSPRGLARRLRMKGGGGG